MRPLSYTAPRSTSEAVQAFVRAGPGASYIGGGTSLYDVMKLNVVSPTHLVDISGVEEMGSIDLSGEQLRFGARALMNDVANHPILNRDYPVIAQGVSRAATVQLRNMATLGGNLLQRTRCMYFRNGTGNPSSTGSYPCNKREPGSGCAAIGGIDRGQAVLGQSGSCTAVSPGDWAVALTAMDASIEVLGPEGARVFPIAELYLLPGDTPHREFSLLPGELITAITVPKTPAGRRSAYEKIGERDNFYFSQASAAVALHIEAGRVRKAHVAIGGVATAPWRAPEAEHLLVGKRVTEETALAAGRAALRGAKAGRLNGYKIEIGTRMVAEALTLAAGKAA